MKSHETAFHVINCHVPVCHAVVPSRKWTMWLFRYVIVISYKCSITSTEVAPCTEPPRYTWRSTCMAFVYVISFTWQAFTWSNYCVTHDCVTSMCVKYIWMTKVTKAWRNKTMTHINKTRITLTWRHKYINSTHVTHKNNYMTYHYMT